VFALLSTLTWLATVVGDAPPDAEGAKALEAMYSAYFSTKAVEQGVIEVTPEGSSYVVTWDLQKAAELADIPASKLKIDPFAYRLTPASGGVWTLSADSFPNVEFDASPAQPNAHYVLKLDGFGLQGRYDPAKEPFLTSKLTIGQINNEVLGADPSAPKLSTVTYSGITFDTEARTAPAGGVDFEFSQQIGAMSQSVKPGEKAGGFGVDLATSGSDGGGAAKGVRAREIGEIWKYLVERAEANEKPSNAAPLLTAALPLWDRLEAKGDSADMKVETEIGAAQAKKIGSRIAISGVSDPGRMEVGIDFDGLSLSSPLAPPWVSKLTPAAAHIAFAISDKGVDRAARLFLADPAFGSADPSKATQDAATAAIVGGDPKLTFEANNLKTPIIDLAFAGELGLASAEPTGHFHVTVDSLDKLMALGTEIAASDPSVQQGLLGLSLIKGLAKTSADGRLAWDIDIAGKKVIINGTPMPASP
jgi:hypothetical protein